MNCQMLGDQACIYGPYGTKGETVCKYCGFTSAKIINKSIEEYQSKMARSHSAFDRWFFSAPHRAKYLKDQPAYLAAQEAWHERFTQHAKAIEYVVLVLQAVENGDGVFLGDAERAIRNVRALMNESVASKGD